MLFRSSADMKVPVIDLGPYLGGEANALQRTAMQLREASESLGFYFIANHGVDQRLICGARGRRYGREKRKGG